jgi:hypothetical protein
MRKPKCERQLAAGRDAEHGGAFNGQCHAKPRSRPSPNVRDEEPLVCGEPFRFEMR